MSWLKRLLLAACFNLTLVMIPFASVAEAVQTNSLVGQTTVAINEPYPYHSHALQIGINGSFPLGDVLGPALFGFIEASLYYQWNPRLIDYFWLEGGVRFTRYPHLANGQYGLTILDVSIQAMKGLQLFDPLALIARVGTGFASIILPTVDQSFFFVRPLVSAWLGVEFAMNYHLSLELGMAYRLIFDAGSYDPVTMTSKPPLFIHSLSVGGMLTLRFGADPVNRDIRIDSLRLDDLFAAQASRYRAEPIGTVIITNDLDLTMVGVQAALEIEGLLEPVQADLAVAVSPGETRSLPVFTNPVAELGSLAQTESRAASLVIRYTIGSESRTKTERYRVILHSMNELTWEDTRRLGSFITSQDSTVQTITRGVIASIPPELRRLSRGNLPQAVSLFATLKAMGLSYLADPRSPYAQASRLGVAVDYVQYPAQLLQTKTGDCDDLVTLFAAMLENAGIATALITTPGHISLAFRAGIDPSVVDMLGGADKVLIINNDVWIPVEVTLLDQDFYQAWSAGLRGYQDADRVGQVEFTRVDEAWQEYPANSNSISTTPPILPKADLELIVQAQALAVQNGIRSDLEDRVVKLEQELRNPRTPADAPILTTMAILKATLNNYEAAIVLLDEANQLLPNDFNVLANLGSIRGLQGDYDASLVLLEQARTLRPLDDVIGAKITMVQALTTGREPVMRTTTFEGNDGSVSRASQATDPNLVLMQWHQDW